MLICIPILVYYRMHHRFPNRSRTLGDLRADVDSLEQRGDALAAGIVALEADDDVIRQEAANTAADLMQLGGVVATNKEDVSSPKITDNLSKFKRTPPSFFATASRLTVSAAASALAVSMAASALAISAAASALAIAVVASALPISCLRLPCLYLWLRLAWL